MLTPLDIVVRMLASALFGGVVGFERERHNQPAGLRTHVILSIGSCLAMCVSINLAMQFRSLVPNGDPARLAAQVLSGIGFLGAGAILRYGTNVRGLTTAASLWTIAVVGLAAGAGHFIPALVATALLFAVLQVLDRLEKRYMGNLVPKIITVRAKDRYGVVDEVKNVVQGFHSTLKTMSLSKNLERHEIEIEAVASIPAGETMDKVFFSLSSIKDVTSVEVQ
ncbi:MAG: MgtC/SapB family protein [Candidatus Aureabacteria bacterium]|nr:MgtC/SapB family protein [Candidatus Auribacterota bacterium]